MINPIVLRKYRSEKAVVSKNSKIQDLSKLGISDFEVNFVSENAIGIAFQRHGA